METQALVELLRESGKVLRGTGDRYLKPNLTVVPDPPPAVDEDGKPQGNVLALRWIDTAMRLERDLVELRHFCLAMFIWIVNHEDTLAVARDSIDRRFPVPAEVSLAA